MIPGFENYTHEMNKKEIQVAYLLIANLPLYIGKNDSITNAQMRRWLLKKHDIKITGPRVRHILHVLRCTDTLEGIVAYGNGYHYEPSYNKFAEYEKSLTKRMKSFQDLLNAVRRQLLKRKTGLQGKQSNIPF